MNDPTGLFPKIIDWLLKNIACSDLVVRSFLSREEKDILKEAIGTGEIYKLSTDETGAWVRVNKPITDLTGAVVRMVPRNFCSDDNPEITQAYNEALDRLIEKKLVFHESDILYKLTSKGCRIAKKLK